MPPDPQAEIVDLKARLAVAEETLSAIYNHEVDALIVAGPEGDQVFTLQGAEMSYRLLVEAMNEGALTVIPDGTILYCNNRFAEMARCPMEQVTGSTWHRFFSPDEQLKIKALLAGAGPGGRKHEVSLQTEDGCLLPVQLSARSMILEGVEAFAVLVTDVAELKSVHKALRFANQQLETRVQERTLELAKANELLRGVIAGREKIEESLRASEKEFRAIFESAAAGKAQADPETGKFQRVNGKMCEIVGYSVEELIGRSFFEITHPEDRERIAAGVRSMLAGELQGYSVEKRYLHKQGHVVWVQLAATVFRDDSGKPLRINEVVQDITARKLTEEALAEAQGKLHRHADQLEKRVQERTRRLQGTIEELEAFSYSVSHDLRAPLRSIQSFSQILIDECSAALSPEGRDYLRRVVSSADRLDKLILDVLAYSRTARADVTLVPVSFDDVTRDVIRQYPMFQKEGVEISIEGTLPRVLAHEASLTQCVSNLLGNAVKFVSPGTNPRIKIRAEAVGTEARVWFEDNGIGISKRDQERIFKIFERVHAGESYAGTGIGLSIVKKAIERMGGTSGVESELGRGSRFWIQLSSATNL